MKIGILSDTHDNVVAVDEIIDILNAQNIPVAMHAGDLIHPGVVQKFESYYQGTLHFVLGNNDGEKVVITELAHSSEKLLCHNREMELELQGKRIYMNHYSHIGEAFSELGKFDLCIGGHDHHQRVIRSDKSVFINPGHTLVNTRIHQDYPKHLQHTFAIFDLATMQEEVIELTTSY